MDEKFAALSEEHSAERKELLDQHVKEMNQFETKIEQLEKNLMSMQVFVQFAISFLCLSKFWFIERDK